jgi:hypothetical protein
MPLPAVADDDHFAIHRGIMVIALPDNRRTGER